MFIMTACKEEEDDMPRGLVATVPVDKEFFMAVVKARKSSLRKLGGVGTPGVECSEKTLRRALNSGGIRLQYAEQIAKELNVDRDFLLGDPDVIPVRILKTDKETKARFVQSRLERYPHFSSLERDSIGSWIDVTLKGILTTFGVSYDRQFMPMETEKKYAFLEELCSEIAEVLQTHFPEDAYGDKSRWKYHGILAGLNGWYEDQLGIPEETFKESDDICPSDEHDDFDAEFWNSCLKDNPV